MFEIVKAIHEALHIESTWAFVLILAMAGGLATGAAAWVVDKGYRNSVKEHQQAQAVQVTTQPRGGIDIKIIRGGLADNSIDASGGTFAYMEMLVTNTGKRTGLVRWLISVQDGDKWIVGNTAVIKGGPPKLKGKGLPQTLPGRNKYIPDTTLGGLESGEIVSGYLTARFIQPKTFFDSQLGRKIEVSCLDAFGNEWKADAKIDPGLPLDMTKTTPGIR